MSNTANYVLLYAGYCVGIDFLDRNTELLQKQTGIFGKAESFPYIDAWTITHVAWGAIAKRMGLSFPVYTGLSVLNEVVLEQLVCKYAEKNPLIHFSKSCDSVAHMAADVVWGMAGYFLMPTLTKNFKSSGTLPKIMWQEGYLTEGEHLDLTKPPNKVGDRWVHKPKKGAGQNLKFGFTTDFEKASRPFRKVSLHKEAGYEFYVFKFNLKPYHNRWIFLVMKDGERKFITYFPQRKREELQDSWVNEYLKEGLYIEEIKSNEPVPTRLYWALKAQGKTKPLETKKISFCGKTYWIIEGEEFVKPCILSYANDMRHTKSPSLIAYYDWIKNLGGEGDFNLLNDSDWVKKTGQEEKLILRKGNRGGIEGLEKSFERVPLGGNYLIGNHYFAGFYVRWSQRSKEKNGKRKIDGFYFSNDFNYPGARKQFPNFPEEEKQKIAIAQKWATSMIAPYEPKSDNNGRIVPNRPPMPLSLIEEIQDGVEKILIKGEQP